MLNAIDGNHISIIALKINPKSYDCWKNSYSTMTQGIINVKCSFWDYDYGWANSIHD
jgi:hypothetical protein